MSVSPLRWSRCGSLGGLTIDETVEDVEMELAERFARWLALKPATQNLDAAEQCALLIQILGGCLSWLSKQGTPAFQPGLDNLMMLDLWADRWAG